MIYKLGSLFDGSGGFPLAGALCGIEPTWAAEVEPYPIAVTRSRFDGDADTPLLNLARKHHPELKLISVHLGNVCEINGAEIEPVDIITFGSPCQDLSVAGKRAGLKHEANGDEETTRSGLFMEAVRIIKEMREATNGRYPTFALWENVPGAFSSNNGEDFRVVCEELIKIVEPTAVMPSVPKGGWAYADSYCGDGWSLAYRVFDAQFWGVPQRRRRIHLIVDFRGERAREILFEREGLRGYFAQGRAPWKGTAPDAQNGTGADDCAGEIGGGRETNAVGAAFGFDRYNQCSTGSVCETLRTPGGGDNYPTVCYGVTAKGNSDAFISEERHTSLSTGGGMPGQGYAVAMVPYTLKIRSGVAIDSAGKAAGKGPLVQVDKAATLSAVQDQYLFAPTYALDQQGGKGSANYAENIMPTLCGDSHGTPHAVAYSFDSVAVPAGGFCPEQSAKTRGIGWEEEKAPTLRAGATPRGGVRCQRQWCGEPAVAYGLDRASFNQGQNAKFDFSVTKEQQPTLVAKGPGAVAYWDGSQVCGTLTANNAGGNQRMPDKENFNGVVVAYGTDVGWLNSCEDQSPTLLARQYKDPHLVTYPADKIHYIVRRLTPTECARLQGFDDRWGDINHKDSFTDEEYLFWLDVRTTHAAINGKAAKDYTKEQMLKWYNNLHTDSAEYKMWGNGIALPPALYCMQGIAEALKSEDKEGRDDG